MPVKSTIKFMGVAKPRTAIKQLLKSCDSS